MSAAAAVDLAPTHANGTLPPGDGAPAAAADANLSSSTTGLSAAGESAAASASASHPAPGPPPLPSESVLRASIRSLLLTSDLSVLTVKMVRAHLCKVLSLSEDVMEQQLKKEVKRITHEEMEGANQAEAAAAAAAAPSSPSKGKGKKNKLAEEGGSAVEASPAKRQKKEASSSSSSSSSSGSGGGGKKDAAQDDGNADAADEAAHPSDAGESQEDADARLAAELAAEEEEEGRRPRRAAAAANIKPPRSSKPRKIADPNAPKRAPPLAALSPALCAFFDNEVTELSRNEVVKRLWAYVKANELQDPNDGRRIILDDKLKTIFGERTKSVGMFAMNKPLQKHMKNKDQLTDS